MRRALSIGRVVLVYLLLGFVTTWAVAWALALLPPAERGIAYGWDFWAQGGGRSRLDGIDRSGGIGSLRYDYRLREPYGSDEYRSSMLYAPWAWDRVPDLLNPDWFERWGHRHQWNPSDSRFPTVSGVDIATGFPFLSQWCNWRVDAREGSWHAARPPPLRLPSDSLSGGIALPDRKDPSIPAVLRIHALPYYPIWSGLALNTAFYALLFFAVVRIGRAVKHARRYRRGLCPRCKYDRLFDYRPPCPECGCEGRRRKNHATGAA